MLSYLPAAVCASLDPALLPAGMVAVRAADLQSLPGERGAVPAGAAVAPGTVVTFCQPVVTVPAVARGGLVLADGWLPELVRLGELERHLGEGVIEELVSAAIANGRLLVQVPFAREWHVPTPKVITCWRVPVPPSVMEELFWQAAAPLVADDANRKAFGCSGTSSQHGTGSAPFPQIQAVVVTARAGRAALGAICGRARAGEQALLARLIRRRPQVFADR